MKVYCWPFLCFFAFSALFWQAFGDFKIALIGKSGQGKSTLANALMGNNETFELCGESYTDPPCTKNVTIADNEICFGQENEKW